MGTLGAATIAALFAIVNIIEILLTAKAGRLAGSPAVVQALWALHAAGVLVPSRQAEDLFAGWRGGVGSAVVTPDERWLAAVWPFVRDSLPVAPARVVEIGCGPLGGFVPMLEPAGCFFPDLAGTSEADEQAAIDSGLIKANRIQYVGQRKSYIPAPA